MQENNSKIFAWLIPEICVWTLTLRRILIDVDWRDKNRIESPGFYWNKPECMDVNFGVFQWGRTLSATYEEAFWSCRFEGLEMRRAHIYGYGVPGRSILVSPTISWSLYLCPGVDLLGFIPSLTVSSCPGCPWESQSEVRMGTMPHRTSTCHVWMGK
jgi:hypothetical protein